MVGPGAIVGDGPFDDRPNKQEPTRLNTGITVVGKRAFIPRGTRIGRNVRSGSNTVFVAPVEVGDGAYTGAGSVVNRDVPPGALAKGVPAKIEEGWAQRRDNAGDDPAPAEG